jgi:hypothetical protein
LREAVEGGPVTVCGPSEQLFDALGVFFPTLPRSAYHCDQGVIVAIRR